MRLSKNRTAAVVFASKAVSRARNGGLCGTTALTGGVVAALLAFMPLAAEAQVVWNGATDTNALTGTNWVGNVAPAAGDQAELNTAAGNQPALGGATTYTGLAISAGTYTVGGAGSLTSPVTLSGAGNLSISAGGSVTGLVTAGGATVSNSGTITGNLIVTAGTVTNAGVVTGETEVNGGTLTLNAGSNLSDTQRLLVNAPGIVNVNVNETVSGLQGSGTVNLNGATLTTGDASIRTFSGVLAGTGGLTVQGTNETILSGNANTYSGLTTVNSGILALSNGGAIADAGVVVVNAPGILRITTSETIGSLAGSGSVEIVAGILTTGGNNGATTVSGVISGAGGLTKAGIGTMTLSGANTYTGGTTINSGTIALGTATGLGAATGALTINGGTLNLGGFSPTVASLNGTAGNITNGTVGNAILTVNGGGTQTYGGTFNPGVGLVSLTVAGGTTLTLNGAANLQNVLLSNAAVVTLNAASTIAGSISVISAGTLVLNAANTMAGGINIGGGGGTSTLILGATGAAGGAGNTITTFGSIISYANGVDNATPININSPATQLQVLGTDVATQSGIISETAGPRPLQKIGTGTLALTAANTYTGAAAINAGVLNIQNATGLGTTAGGTVVAAGAALELQGGIAIGAEALTLNSTGVAGGGALRNISGNNTFGGAITLASASTISTDAGLLTLSGAINNGGFLLNVGSGNVTVSGAISGTGGLTKAGPRILTLTGTNTFTGDVNVTGGTLQTTGGAALADTVAVTVAGGAIYQAFGPETIGSLAGAGNLILQPAGTVLTTGGNNASTTFSGVITEGGVGNGSLVKAGTGIFTLTGNSNAFGGTTNVNAGILRVDGTLGSAASTLNVNAGATLQGTGTVGGNVNVLNAGILAPGASPGTLTIAGNLVLANGSITNFEINTTQQIGGVGVTGNDLVNVGGTLNVAAGAVLNVGPAVTGYYRLFNVTGAGAATATNFTVNPPGGSTAEVYSIVAAPSQVNLLLRNGGQSLQFWDGADQTGATAGAQGGASTWNAANTNWTQNPGGVINDRWRSGVGVFVGAAGTVALTGAQSFEGLQFSTTGYIVDGPGTLNMTGNPFGNANASFINVDGGSTATVNAVITGAAGISLDKLGGGTLVLAGVNTYTGLTTVTAGTLNVAATGVVAGSVLNNATFVNAGTVAGSLTNNAGATNTGTINGGVVNAAGASLSTSGTINGGLTNAGTAVASGIIAGGVVNSGAFSVSGPLNNSGGDVTNNNPGVMTLGAGTAFTNIATFTNNAAAANAVTVNAGATLSAVTLRNLAGTFTNLGTVTAPVVVNAGTLTTSNTLSAATSFNNTGTVNASGVFNTPAATNTGVFTVQGNLGGATAVFNNQAGGLVNLAGGSFTGIGAFNNAGTLQSTSGAARTIGAATFNNQATGVVNLANGSVTDQLTITGAYAGTPGSQVRVDIDLSRQDAGVRADRVVVAGAASGTSAITFNIVNPNRTVFATPIEVMTTGAGAVAVNEGEIVGARRGFFGYFLRREAAGAGSSYQVVSRFNSGPVAGVASGITGMISSLQAGFHQPASAIISRPDNCQPNQLMGGPFIRMSTGESTLKNTTTGDVAGGGSPFSGASKSETRFSGIQTGADIGVCNINNSGWNVHTGIMGGIVETNTSGLSRTPDPSGGTFSQTRTTAKVEVPFIGAYIFATNGAFTSEINVRKDFYNAKVTALDPVNNITYVGPEQKLKGNGLNFNAALSYRFSFAESWYVEPQVGFSKGTTSFSALQFAGSTTDFMTFRKSDSMLGRVGLNLGTAVQATDNLVVVPFISAAIWHEFAKPTKAQAVFGSNGNQTFEVKTDRVGTFGQIGGGLQFRVLNTPFVGFIRADARFGSKIEGKALNAGLRMQF